MLPVEPLGPLESYYLIFSNKIYDLDLDLRL